MRIICACIHCSHLWHMWAQALIPPKVAGASEHPPPVVVTLNFSLVRLINPCIFLTRMALSKYERLRQKYVNRIEELQRKLEVLDEIEAEAEAEGEAPVMAARVQLSTANGSSTG